ncbi:hypothetical protein J6590_099332, partial [Homalodisca vitripennis]
MTTLWDPHGTGGHVVNIQMIGSRLPLVVNNSNSNSGGRGTGTYRDLQNPVFVEQQIVQQYVFCKYIYAITRLPCTITLHQNGSARDSLVVTNDTETCRKLQSRAAPDT